MPEVQGAPGSRHEVVVSAGTRRTRPLALYLGRVPLVVSFEPARGVTGDLVRIHGAGFAAAADGNAVTFDGVPALVVAASPRSWPSWSAKCAPQRDLVPVVCRPGAASSERAGTLQQLLEGVVPRFPGGGAKGVKGPATVGTDRARDAPRGGRSGRSRRADPRQTAVDRARLGQPARFEAREQPTIGVALVGAPDLVVRATPQDAAAYQAPPGLPARGAPPTPIELARHWAALLDDTFVVATSGGQPKAALAPAPRAAFAQLRAALPWQYGSGTSNSRVVARSSDLRRRLREAALRVP
jgi:hypothetical protein